jgi:Fe-S cluster biogenesis protein NfuA
MSPDSSAAPTISLEFTPNPQSLKYVTEKSFNILGTHSFNNLQEASGKSALAETLLSLEGIESVLIGSNFVTITKKESQDWDKVHFSVEKSFSEFLTSGAAPFSASHTEEVKAQSRSKVQGLDDISAKVITILDSEIRPAVAADGGDIQFDRIENGVVYLIMQGACSGCPSSTMTLKMGIEARLKELIPEIKSVEAV